MSCEAVILDGYVDEPTCLGVPPYISPYIRYCAGVLVEHGYVPRYLTIDQLRSTPTLFNGMREVALVVVIAGLTVPGKYLAGTPATLTELQQVGLALKEPTTILGGPIQFGYAGKGGKRAQKQMVEGFDSTLEGSPAEALDNYLSGGEPRGTSEYRTIDRWAVKGSAIITQHPSFPHLMCEMETGSGCSRTLEGGCSFCTERFAGLPRYRAIEGIAAEVGALYAAGGRHFRLGKQPDLLVYGRLGGAFPAPDPDKLERLFLSIREQAPSLRTLHIDNINPGTIARHEDDAREALQVIVRWHTPGDTAALGMETADPEVVRSNNLKAMPEEVFQAINVINEVGVMRKDGIPELLPGLNFVTGLAGETAETYALNRQFLDRVLASGLLLRRVNIRQVMPFEGTPAYVDNTLGQHIREFRSFKDYVRQHIDLSMLRKVFPVGTVLREVIIEVEGMPSFGRQLGSYPILAGFPLFLKRGMVVEGVVVDHGMRSITCLPYPIAVNTLPPSALLWLPEVGKKRVARIVRHRPIQSLEEWQAFIGPTPLDGALQF